MKKMTCLFSVVVIAMVVFPLAADASSLVGNRAPLAEKVSINLNGSGRSVWTAGFQAQVRNDEGELVNGGEWFEGFCVELGQWAKTGTSNVDLVDPSLVEGGLHAAWIMDNRDLYKQDHAGWSGHEIAGLQLAIWEVTHNYSDAREYSLDSGAFRVTRANAGTRDLADFYLSSLSTMFDPFGLDSNYQVAQNQYNQDLIFNVPGEPVENAPVPEPATMLLLGLGILALAGINRKIKK